MNISICGLGKLGLPLAASFAGRGIRVVGVDSNPEVIEGIAACKPLIYEPGLSKALQQAGGMLTATTDIVKAVVETDTTIILVPTPSEDDGWFSLEYVLQVCKELGTAIREHKSAHHYHNVVCASTVMPGSCAGKIWRTLERESGRKIGNELGLCYCPEFVALGDALAGFQRPDLVLIGQSDNYAGGRLELVYRRFCSNNPPIWRTGLINAEIAKIALNFFVTTKISVANTLAEICEKLPGADVDQVTGAIGLDSRIGGKYLKGATGFGGTCFPRDVRAFMALTETVGASQTLALAIHEINQHQLIRLIDMLSPKGMVLGILGLAFKPNTDVTVESTGMALIQELGAGQDIVAYDPIVQREFCAATAQECVDHAGVVVITIPYDEFKSVRFHAGQRVIDCWRILDRDKVQAAGARYVGIGLGD